METKQRVLIVDDEPRNQRIICEILEGLVDFQVASTGEAALAAVESYDPHLVLLDIMMPGIDGYEVCRQIRANPKMSLTKVILVSGKAMIEERLKGYECGADDYMTKPFESEELLAKAKVFLKLSLLETQLANMNQILAQRVQEKTAQLQQVQAQLINTAKMAALGEMAGGIAHEINTPLSIIHLLESQIGELIQEDPIDRKTVLEMIQTISATVIRISTIVRGLRTFSREGGTDKFDHVPLATIIDYTLGLCREKLKYKKVILEIEPFPEDLMLDCRHVQISQVLLSLITNSCDAIEECSEKWIKIGARKQNGWIEMWVVDSGKGIPEAIRNKVFDPFFTSKPVGQGTGLGLSVAKGIIDSHGGSLRVDEQCENTRFVISLPQRQPGTAKLDQKVS